MVGGIEIEALEGLEGHVGGQWAIQHGPLYEIFMVYGRIYLYGRSTIVHTCLHSYNPTTEGERGKEEAEEEQEDEIKVGRDLSWLQAAVSSSLRDHL